MAQRIIIPTIVKCYIAFGVVFSVMQSIGNAVGNIFSRTTAA